MGSGGMGGVGFGGCGFDGGHDVMNCGLFLLNMFFPSSARLRGIEFGVCC